MKKNARTTAAPPGGCDKPSRYLSIPPRRLLLLAMGWIFLGEFFNMVLLDLLPQTPLLLEALIDSTLLLVIVSPVYFLLYRPFLAQWKARKRMAEELRRSEERYRSLVENVSFGISLIDGEHNLLMTNRAQERLFEQEQGSLVGRKCFSAFQGRSRACSFCPAGETMRSGRPGSAEVEQMLGDGRRRLLRLRTYPVFARNGGVERIIEVAEDITDGKQAEEEIRFLSQQLIRSTEEERKRLARDLHDEFGQILTTLQLGVETLRGSLPGDLPAQQDQCRKLSGLIARLGDQVRETATRLRPAILDDMGLVSALRWHVERFASEMEHFEIDFHVEGEAEDRLPAETEVALYRLCQEALNNIAKHAQATRIAIRLASDARAVSLSIRDDGKGFEQPRGADALGQGRGIGLLGMRERISHLGGNLSISSQMGVGTELQVEVPLVQKGGG